MGFFEVPIEFVIVVVPIEGVSQNLESVWAPLISIAVSIYYVDPPPLLPLTYAKRTGRRT